MCMFLFSFYLFSASQVFCATIDWPFDMNLATLMTFDGILNPLCILYGPISLSVPLHPHSIPYSFHSILSSIPSSVPFHPQFHSTLSSIPSSVPFHPQFHSILSSTPPSVPFHPQFHSILSSIPSSVPFHPQFHSILSSTPSSVHVMIKISC